MIILFTKLNEGSFFIDKKNIWSLRRDPCVMIYRKLEMLCLRLISTYLRSEIQRFIGLTIIFNLNYCCWFQSQYVLFLPISCLFLHNFIIIIVVISTFPLLNFRLNKWINHYYIKNPFIRFVLITSSFINERTESINSVVNDFIKISQQFIDFVIIILEKLM